MEQHIRMAEQNDIEELIALRFDYFRAENWELTAEKRNIIKTNLRQYFTKHLNIDFLAALMEIDKKIVSIAFLVLFEKPANLSFPTGKTGTILNVFTHPEYRNKGYATQILKILIDEAKRQNLSYVDLSASESGKPIYEKLGFKEKKSARFTEMKLFLL